MCSLILCLAHTFAHWGICLLQQVIIITWLGEKRQKKKKMKTNFCILYCLTKLQLPIGSMTVLLNISPEPWGKYIAQLQPKALTMVNNEAIYPTTRGSPAASSARAEHAPQYLRPPSGPDLNHKSDHHHCSERLVSLPYFQTTDKHSGKWAAFSLGMMSMEQPRVKAAPRAQPRYFHQRKGPHSQTSICSFPCDVHIDAQITHHSSARGKPLWVSHAYSFTAKAGRQRSHVIVTVSMWFGQVFRTSLTVT